MHMCILLVLQERVKELMKKCSISPARQESEQYNQFKFNLAVFN